MQRRPPTHIYKPAQTCRDTRNTHTYTHAQAHTQSHTLTYTQENTPARAGTQRTHQAWQLHCDPNTLG